MLDRLFLGITMLTKRQILAVLIAPLTAPVVFTLVLTAGSVGNNWSDFIDTLLLIMAFGVPISYLVTLFFGLPLYKLVKRIGVINYWTMALGGAIAVGIPLFLLKLTNSSVMENDIKDIYTFGLILFCGFVVGTVCWLIGYSSQSK